MRKVVVPALLAASVLLAGCNGKPYDNTEVTYANGNCQAFTDPSAAPLTSQGTGIYVGMFKSVPWIIGSVYVTCSPEPTSHMVDVELWFHSFGSTGWEDVSSRSSNNLPPSSHTFPYQTTARCTPGLWQVRWSVVGDDLLGEPFVYRHEWAVKTLTALGCKDPSGQPTGGDGPVYP